MSTFVTHKTEGIFNKPFVHLVAIIFVVLMIYSSTFNAPFQFDDISTIIENVSIHDPHNYLPPKANRDIGFLTFSMNYQLNRLDVFGYHAVNLLIHMLNAVLVYALVSLTFSTPFFMPLIYKNTSSISKRNISYLGAFLASGLFAVHPLQTESVTYITQRFTSLATLFYLMSLVMYIKWRLNQQKSEVTSQSPSATRRGGKSEERQKYSCLKSYILYLASFSAAVLAMKTKEIAFTLPICLAVYEFMFFRGKPIKRALYLFPLLITMLIIPMTLLSLSGPLGDIIGDVSEVTRDHPDIPRWSYLFTQFRVIVTYLRLLIIPINQNLDYDYPVYHSLLDPAVFLSFIFVLLVFSLGVYLYRISRYPEAKDRYWLRLTSFGIFWFFMTLSVESSVIPLKDIIFEHRVYLPSIGFFIALTAAIGAGMERWGSRAAYAKKAVVYVMLTVMLALSGVAYARNDLWKDSVRLWENAAEGSPNKARPHLSLGLAYFYQGRSDEAINEYKTALKINPDYADAHNNLGVAYRAQGRFAEAINEYKAVLMLKPDNVDVHNNLGNSYGAQGRPDEAIKEYKIALNLNPNDAEVHNNLGAAYVTQGRIDEAISECQIALKLNPDYADAHNNLGVAYRAQGRFAEAINEYQAALKLNPDYAEAHFNLGLAYTDQGRSDEALKEFKTALNLKLDFAQARQALDFLLKK